MFYSHQALISVYSRAGEYLITVMSSVVDSSVVELQSNGLATYTDSTRDGVVELERQESDYTVESKGISDAKAKAQTQDDVEEMTRSLEVVKP